MLAWRPPRPIWDYNPWMIFRFSLRSAICLGLTLTCSSALAVPIIGREPSPDQSLAIGIGVGAPLDYEPDVTFADAITVARAMEPAPRVTADQDGWLNGDGDILVWAMPPNRNTAGTYRLKYDGRAQVEAQLCDAKVSPEVYDKKTNTSTREVVLATDQQNLKLSFRQTTAGVKHVKLMRPVRRGAKEAHRFDEMWYRPMKEVHRPFAWIRTMDLTATNGQNVVSWNDRTRPSRWSQENLVEGSGWQGRGAAWEYVIHMANEEQKDLWINVPLLADDEYVRKLAQLIHFGSDGKEPYTEPRANPVWAPLAPNLKLYVEDSNELWNFGFPQWTQMLARSTAEVQRGGKTELNYDGTTSDGEWNMRYWARRVVQISTMFRTEFGDAAMMSRIRPVFETQLGWADNYLARGLTFIDLWYNNGDGQRHVASPHPVRYYVWGAGGSTYPVGFPDEIDQRKKLTVAQIFAGMRSMLGTWTKHQQRDIDYVRAFGLKRVSYEGGTGVDNRFDATYAAANAVKDKAQRDPKIGPVYAGMLRRYAELGGDLHTNFLTTNVTHGVLPVYDGSAPSTPKLTALCQAMAGPKPAITWGAALPSTIWAGRYRVSARADLGEHDGAVKVTPSDWYGYTVRTSAPGRYVVRVRAASTGDNARLNVWVDGDLAGVLTLPRTGSSEQFADSERIVVPLEAGQHGIRLDGLEGTFSVERIEVTKEAK
jgi:hypothetical protein